MKFGRLPVKADSRNLQYAKYATAELPAPMLGMSSIYRMEDGLKLRGDQIPPFFPMLGNDLKGDCTVAAALHLNTLFDGLLGQSTQYTTQQAVSTYETLTGGADDGLACADVLDYWKNTDIGGKQIIAYVELDITNHTEVKQAIDLFGAVYLGFNVQENCLSDFNANPKVPWQPGPLTNDGHCVAAVAYNSDMLRVLTWGDTQLATWDWWDACVDEAYVILPSQARSLGFTTGFDFETLQADLALL